MYLYFYGTVILSKISFKVNDFQLFASEMEVNIKITVQNEKPSFLGSRESSSNIFRSNVCLFVCYQFFRAKNIVRKNRRFLTLFHINRIRLYTT